MGLHWAPSEATDTQSIVAAPRLGSGWQAVERLLIDPDASKRLGVQEPNRDPESAH
jgi:hypothetical protein